jgi:hypothetical protein
VEVSSYKDCLLWIQNESPDSMWVFLRDHWDEAATSDLIIQLSDPVTPINEFVSWSTQHRARGFSLVLAGSFLHFDDLEALEISAAPTLQEAYDLIEMERIERDLGF